MNDPGTEADHPLFYLKKVAASLSINLARVPHTFWTLSNERDLGVTIDDELKFEEHMIRKVRVANGLVGQIRRRFSFFDSRNV